MQILNYDLVGSIRNATAAEITQMMNPVQVVVQPQMVQQPVMQPVQPVQTPAPAPAPVPAPVAAPAAASYYFYGKKVQYTSLKKSTMLFNGIFKGMPTADRKALNPAYNKFNAGSKSRGADQMNKYREAALQARKLIWDGRTADRPDWSQNALQLVAYMLEWAEQCDAGMYEDAQCWYEAALSHFEEGTYHRAAVCAAKALPEYTDDADRRKNLMIVLAESIVQTDDASPLNMAEMQNADGRQELEADLLRYKNKSPYERELLPTLYANTVKAAPEQKPESPAPAAEPVADDRMMGMVTKLPIIREEGEITGTDGEKYKFPYRNVTSSEFYNRLMEYRGSKLAEKNFWVTFRVYNGVAKQVEQVVSPVSRGNTAVNEKKYQEALGLYRQALKTPEAGRALLGMGICASALYDDRDLDEAMYEAGQELCSEILEQYELHEQEYPRTMQGYSYLGKVYFLLKDYDEALRNTRCAMDLPDLPVQLRMTLLAQYARFGCICAMETGNLRHLPETERCVNRWEELYRTGEMDQDGTMNNIFATVLSYRCRAACLMEKKQLAQEDLRKICAKMPHLPTWVQELKTMVLGTGPKPEEPAEEPAEVPVEAPATEPVGEPAGDPVSGADAEPLPEADEMDTMLHVIENVVVKPAEAETPAEEPSAEVAEETPAAAEDTWDDEDDYPDEEELQMDSFWQNDDAVPEYHDEDGWKALKTTTETVAGDAIAMGAEGQLTAMTAYLLAGSRLNGALEPLYRTVALALNAPGRDKKPVPELTELYCRNDENYPVLNDYCFAASILRTAYMSNRADEVAPFCEQLAVYHQMPTFEAAYQQLMDFYNETGAPADLYAGYRNHVVRVLSREHEENRTVAKRLYTTLYENYARENTAVTGVIETRNMLFGKDTDLARLLYAVANNNRLELIRGREAFAGTYLLGGDTFAEKRINQENVDEMIAECREQANLEVGMRKKASSLQGNLRNHMRSQMKNVIACILRWYVLDEENDGQTQCTEQGWTLYNARSAAMTEALQQLSEACDAAGADEAEDCAGRRILKRTADELLRRMDGRWKSGEERYFYADFLSGSNIMLDDNFMPELQATLCVLPEFNVLARIRRHAATEPMTLQERMDLIYGEDLNDNNYGMADRILEYAEFKNILVTVPENAQEYRRQAARQCIQQMQSFRERYALDKSHGRVMRTDPFCNKLEETVRYWYFFVRDTRNYGFLIHLTRESEVYLHQVAQTFENQLNEQLEALIADNPQVMNDPKIVPMIREQIAQQRFNVAEDWMAQVAKGRLTVEMNRPEALEWLDDFMDNYAHYYEMVSDSGVTLSQRFRLRRIHNRDTKIASDMLENWLISGRPTKPERITRLLDGFGWKNMHVEPFTWNVDTKLELYAVTSDIVPTGPANPLHYIAEFGSHMQKQRTYVACIYGTNLSDRLLSTIKKLDVLDGNKILLVDCAVSSMDRRILAKELKQKEFGCRNTYLIVDRVLLCYLLERYQESSINRMLMALGMPFSYAQPYVVESSQTMPPEIFIGRKDELQEIIRPDGTNLIYGGRQLGKSALMKKARDDTDGDQGKRAVFVDIREKDCAGAALRLAQELRELNVIPEMPDTTDWSTLCSKIRGYLRSPDCAITYLLIMLDEADTFIADCANYSYRPLAELKDIQQSLPGRFKYVLAGLHDVVRFNREVALGHNSVITHMASIRVTPFHPEVAEKLLIEPMSYLGISFPDKVIVSEILAKTNYFPGLIQLYCEKLIQSIREINYAGYNMRYVPPYHVTEDHLKQILTDKFFVYQIQEKFEITLRLDAHYFPLALLMRYMYAHEPQMVKRGYTAAMILERARDLEIKVLADLKVEQINALMEELQDLNIFRTTVDHNTYLLSNKNFQDLLGTNDKEILDKLEPYIGGDK